MGAGRGSLFSPVHDPSPTLFLFSPVTTALHISPSNISDQTA